MPTNKPKKSDLDYSNLANELKSKVAVESSVFYDRYLKDIRSKAFTVSNIQKISLIVEIQNSLAQAIKDGSTFSDWKNSIDLDSLDNAVKRNLQTIYRNNLNTAYNQAQYEDALENKETFPYLKYSAVNDGRTRPSHQALDGIILPSDDPFWNRNTPPNGHNCRCTIIPLTKSQAEREGGKIRKDQLDKRRQGKYIPPGSNTPLPRAKPDVGFDSAIKRNSNLGLEKRLMEVSKQVKSAEIKRQIKNVIGNKNSDVAMWLKLFQNILGTV